MHPSISSGRRRSLLSLSSALLAGPLLLASGAALANDDWPTRPVKIVIAVAAGSSGDTLARLMAPKLEALWKQPVIVENRPGAGGIVGTEHVAMATDAHTLLLASNSSILPKFTAKSLRFDPLTDLVPIYRVINYQLVIATNAQTAKKAKNLQEVIALSKGSDKGVFFAGMGQTAVFNLSMVALNRQLGVKYTAVDFSNVGAMNMALLRDDGQLLVNTPSSIKAHFDTGALVPLAVVSPERYPNLPAVPTVQEAAGYKGFLPQLWAGLMAPKGLPPAVLERIARDTQAVVLEPAMKAQIESTLSGAVQRSSPAAFARDVAEEAGVWKEVFQSMNYKPE